MLPSDKTIELRVGSAVLRHPLTPVKRRVTQLACFVTATDADCAGAEQQVRLRASISAQP